MPDTQAERVVRMDQEVVNKLAAIPGVSQVSFSSSIPWITTALLIPSSRRIAPTPKESFRRCGASSSSRRVSFRRWALRSSPAAISPGRDIYQRIPVAIVSENFAREYWHDAGNALGKRIRVGNNDDWREIIGVVGNTYDHGVDKDPTSSVYWPVIMDHFEGQKEKSAPRHHFRHSQSARRFGSVPEGNPAGSVVG